MKTRYWFPRFWWVRVPTPFRVKGEPIICGIGGSWLGHDWGWEWSGGEAK